MKLSYPVPRLSEAIARERSGPLAARAGVSVEAFLEQPERHLGFPTDSVRIELMDGSSAQFKYAFALVSSPWKAIAVFTEHCGHHVFPFHGARVYQGSQLIFEHSEA